MINEELPKIDNFCDFSSIFNFHILEKYFQSAIKAKLLELGTGSQTGYIDDELPDYVMIMVANKRDKDQMKKDLQLFLGSNTGEIAKSTEIDYLLISKIFAESFVNWLHQVLQKLQEVTLPNNCKMS